MRTIPVLSPLLLLALLLPACDRGPSPDFGDGDAALSAYRVETRVVDQEGEPWLEAEVIPSGPWKINLEYPWALRMQAGAGPQLRGEDAARLDEERAIFRLPASALAEGLPEGMLNLSVCTPDVCLTPRERLAWSLAEAGGEAEEPPIPAAEGGPETEGGQP